MQNELTAERIETAIKEVAESGMYGSQVHQETMETTLAALRAEQERLNPQPLTWEELSEMVGEPVWTIGENCGLDGWDIVEEVYPADEDGDKSILFGRTTETPRRWNYNLRDLNGELSGCAWVCYRTNPEGSAE